MGQPKLASLLLASRRPEALAAWYQAVLNPEEVEEVDGYRVLTFGDFHMLIDSRDDVSDTNTDPARVILNFDVADAKAVVERMEEAGTTWTAELEDRGGSLFATGSDPDGNLVQVIELSEEMRDAMEQPARV